MATLHMEVETVRSTYSNIMNVRSQLESEMQSMSNTVQNTVGSAWIGNSATEFMNEYEQWRSQMTTLLENLNTLASRLQAEITEWENMAARL